MELPVANKLSAQAQELEDEAVQLEEQKLPIAAAAKLQKAGELHDGARILRQGHSGRVISSRTLPADSQRLVCDSGLARNRL